MMQKTQHTTKIIAHRGDASEFPENTLEAFEAARSGDADGIELDVHMTSDGQLVVHHDYYLGNPDDGHGTIPNSTFAQFRKAKVKNTYHLPTLEEVFAKIGNTLYYELELKAPSDEAIRKIIVLVQKFSLTANIEFTSPHPYILTRLKQLNPSLTTGYFCAPKQDWMDQRLYITTSIANAQLGNIDVVHFPPNDIDEQLIAAVQAGGMKVHGANCDTKEDLSRMFTLGVDQISTNELARAIAARKQASQS
jgi:glycerophosphoryl diester phosphodiesterase